MTVCILESSLEKERGVTWLIRWESVTSSKPLTEETKGTGNSIMASGEFSLAPEPGFGQAFHDLWDGRYKRIADTIV